MAVGALGKARNRVDTLVDNLKRCFLLLESDKAGCVKMHDVVRDVVLSTASEHGFAVHGHAELKQLKEDKGDHNKAMSLILDDTKELENGLHCPMLELLQVQSQSKEAVSWPENFIQGTSKIRVLTMMKLCIPIMPSLFQASEILRTLQLEGCGVGDISVIGKELTKLEILSFSYSNIKELPTEIGQLGSLRLLDLTGCDDLDFISANIFANLSRLEELYFRIKNFPWMLNKAALKELRNISQQLKVLEIRVSKVDILPKDLSFKHLERFWIYVAPYANYYDHIRSEYLEPNILQIRATNYNSIKCSSTIMQLAKKCEILILEEVKDLKNVIYELDDSGLQYLKDLRLNFCPNLEYLVDCSTPCTAFPLMKSLSLQYLPRPSEIYKASDHREFKKSLIEFSNLEKLELKFLENLTSFSNSIDSSKARLATHSGLSCTNKPVEGTRNVQDQPVSESNSKRGGCNTLFSFNWMQQFPKLETIELEHCNSLEMVFDMQGYSQSDGQPLSELFPQLQNIEIANLNQLTYVWGNNVPHCVHGFQKLRFLTISGCHSLSHVFTSAIVGAITNLEMLHIGFCNSMETLVDGSGDNEEGDYKSRGKEKTVIFHKLRSLSLDGLPKFGSICTEPSKVEWPSLREFICVSCPVLKISLIPIQLPAKLDNFGVTYDSNIEDTGSSNIKENNSRSFHWSIDCTPWPPKFVRKSGSSKRTSEAVSLARDHGPSISEKKSKAEMSHAPFLEDLDVRHCGLLEELFLLEESNNSTILSYLKVITIGGCDKLETIVAKREERTDMMTFFTHLESLDLSDLPNLVRFCSYGINDKQEGTGASKGDERMTRRNPLIDGLLVPNLKFLSIWSCNKINILLSYSSLRGLEHLQVTYCESIEEIISEGKIEAKVDKLTFASLQRLYLVGLPNLKAFCQGSCDFDFPLLQEVIISDCPNMEVFSRGSCNTPKLQHVAMAMESHSSQYIQKRDLNATIEEFKAFVALQESEMMRWSDLHDRGIFSYFIKNSEMTVAKFHELLMLVPFNEIRMLQHVRELNLTKCDSPDEVFESKGGKATKNGYPTTNYELQSTNLEDLPKVGRIWGPNTMRHINFDKLTSVSIIGCDNLNSVLSHSMARSLEQLKELRVEGCKMIEKIVTKEDNNRDGGSKVKTLFPKLEMLKLKNLPKLEYVCSGDYGYDIPLCHEEDKEINNKQQVQISFPQLKELSLQNVPSLRCFRPGAYDYDLMLSSSCIEKFTQIETFPNSKIVVSTPYLHKVNLETSNMLTLGDVNLTIHYLQNLEKYKVELQKLETLTCIEQHHYKNLLAYITRETSLELDSCHKLMNCFPSNMMHSFHHLEALRVQECRCLEEIFESNGYEGRMELSRLELHSLPKLKHIWRNRGPILGFQKMSRLIISKCHDLKFVFPDVSVAESLPNLEQLEVGECNKMEEIIQNDNNSNNNSIPKRAKIIFPALEELQLQKLPKLNCFCSSSFYFELPVCEYIVIEECPKMETFCYETLYTPSLETFQMEGTTYEAGEVNKVIQEKRLG